MLESDGAPPEKRFLLAFTILTTFPLNGRWSFESFS
jgi:hypothetical protein